MHRYSRRLLYVLAITLALAGPLYWRYLQRVVAQEAASPSTERVLVLAGGERVSLTQPDFAVSPSTSSGSISTAGDASGHALPADLRLPPVRLRIPVIELDPRVVLAPANALPQAKVVSWIDGTAFPGAPGNMVLYGYQSGAYKTFTRLTELSAGDDLIITTAGPQPQELHYQVRSSVTARDGDVALLAPTTTPVATLITDFPGSPDKRLVVIADLKPRPAAP